MHAAKAAWMGHRQTQRTCPRRSSTQARGRLAPAALLPPPSAAACGAPGCWQSGCGKRPALELLRKGTDHNQSPRCAPNPACWQCIASGATKRTRFRCHRVCLWGSACRGTCTPVDIGAMRSYRSRRGGTAVLTVRPCASYYELSDNAKACECETHHAV